MEYNVLAGIDITLDRVVMTASGANSNYAIADAFRYGLGSRAYEKSAVNTTSVPDRDHLTGNPFVPLIQNSACNFLWSVDKDGNIVVTQGSVRMIESKNNYLRLKPEPAAKPKDHQPFNYWLVNYTGSSTFVFGVSNWNTAGVSRLMIPILTLPERPIYDDIP